MGHEELKGLLSDYLDGELAPGERPRVEGHLASCEECRRFVEDWKSMRRAFFPAPRRPSASETESFVSRVMTGIPVEPISVPDGGQESDDSPWLPWRWLVPAFALSFAVLALAFIPPRAEQDPSTSLLLADAGGDGVNEWVTGSGSAGLEELLPMERR